jgi:hypothetical protein
LYVNGELQDHRKGIRLSVELQGKSDSGEEIKALISGNYTVQCSLFIDNKLQMPET